MSLLWNCCTQKFSAYSTLFLPVFVMLVAFGGCNGQNNIDEYKAMESLEKTGNEARANQQREFDKMMQERVKENEDFNNRIRKIREQ